MVVVAVYRTSPRARLSREGGRQTTNWPGKLFSNSHGYSPSYGSRGGQLPRLESTNPIYMAYPSIPNILSFFFFLETGFCSEIQVVLKLTATLLSQPTKYWDHRCVLSAFWNWARCLSLPLSQVLQSLSFSVTVFLGVLDPGPG